MDRRIGVGFVGAGTATQAIHIPTLARLADVFEIRGVTDVDEDLARAVASHTGARVFPDTGAMAADPAVSAVCICSPERLHVVHALEAAAAGADAVLCEKPLGTDRAEAEALRAGFATHPVPLVVGTMHATDPVWVEAWPEARSAIGEILAIDSSIVLPFNSRFQAEGAETSGSTDAGSPLVETVAQAVRRRILMLSIHDLPLVRAIAGVRGEPHVLAATAVPPIGYSVLADLSGIALQILGSMRDHWEPEWDLHVIGTTGDFQLRFPPSFVQAGSAAATLRTRRDTRTFESVAVSGYEGEWLRISDILHGRAPVPEIETLVDDLLFALSLADQSAATVEDRG